MKNKTFAILKETRDDLRKIIYLKDQMEQHWLYNREEIIEHENDTYTNLFFKGKSQDITIPEMAKEIRNEIIKLREKYKKQKR